MIYGHFGPLDNWCDHDCYDNPPNSPPGCSCYYKVIPKDTPLIEVNSCFGGTGIYVFKDTIGCKYSSHKVKYNHECCEHVPFHEDMKKLYGAKLFINPEMINS
jgi:hypothetical protein